MDPGGVWWKQELVPPPPHVAADTCVGDCAYCKPHDKTDMPLCSNGEYQWACVSGGRGHRVQCPSVAPMMCAYKKCDGGMDYCCETDCGIPGTEPNGGPRLCDLTHPLTIATRPPTPVPVYEDLATPAPSWPPIMDIGRELVPPPPHVAA